MSPSPRPQSQYTNHLGQPVGEPLPDWTERPRPARTVMDGRLCRLEPLQASRHADALYEAHSLDAEGQNWTYLPYGPFASPEDLARWIESVESSEDPLFFAIIDLATQQATGWASYLRIVPTMGTIEVGHLAYSPALQRTPAATEAMYLMMRRAFDELGYRRYEWKCNSLNAPSWNAAERLGFRYEGTFRQAVVQKGRNRDQAWFSIIDREWSAIARLSKAGSTPRTLTNSAYSCAAWRTSCRRAARAPPLPVRPKALEGSLTPARPYQHFVMRQRAVRPGADGRMTARRLCLASSSGFP